MWLRSRLSNKINIHSYSTIENHSGQCLQVACFTHSIRGLMGTSATFTPTGLVAPDILLPVQLLCFTFHQYWLNVYLRKCHVRIILRSPPLFSILTVLEKQFTMPSLRDVWEEGYLTDFLCSTCNPSIVYVLQGEVDEKEDAGERRKWDSNWAFLQSGNEKVRGSFAFPSSGHCVFYWFQYKLGRCFPICASETFFLRAMYL